jgi:hypothetical protein
VATPTGIAIAALLVSVFAALLAVRADRRAGGAERRDEERIERERQHDIERRRARLQVGLSGGVGGPTADPANYTLSVRNVGASTARNISLIVQTSSGDVRGSWNDSGFVLAPDDPAVLIGVDVRLPRPPGMELWVEWTDDAGDHREDTQRRLGSHP